MTEQEADDPAENVDEQDAEADEGTASAEHSAEGDDTEERETTDQSEAASGETTPEDEAVEEPTDDDESEAVGETADDGTAGIDMAEDLDVADEVLESVESASTEEVAAELSDLRFRVDNLQADVEEYEQRVEELESKLKRKQADFENYKKRMKRRQEEEKERATEDLVTRLVDVRDNLTRALEQDANADIRDGVETTLKQFDRVLDEENVTAIEPDPGDEVEAQRHEVLVRMDSDQPPGTIAQVHRPGYEMAEKVIRPAQVAVSEEDD